MNAARRIVRAVFWGIVVSGLLWIFRRWLSSRARQDSNDPQRSQTPLPEPVLLRRDPYCGTYVAPQISFSFEQAGQIEYFCSAECRDRYARSLRRAASA